jgi:hypothetical protein
MECRIKVGHASPNFDTALFLSARQHAKSSFVYSPLRDEKCSVIAEDARSGTGTRSAHTAEDRRHACSSHR